MKYGITNALLLLVSSLICLAQQVPANGQVDNVVYSPDTVALGAVTSINQRIVQQSSSSRFTIDSLVLYGDKTFTLSRYIALRKEDELKQLADKFQVGNLALNQMQNASSIIQFMGEMVNVEAAVGVSTALWADKDIRNFWDEVQSYGTILGLGIAATAPSMKDNSTDGMIVGGLALSAGAQIVGRLFGDQTGDGLKDKVQFIEFSRQAYDALVTRQLAAKQFISTAQNFRTRLKDFSAQYSSAKTREDQELAIASLKGYIAEFQLILGLVPGYLDSFIALKGMYFVRQNKESLSKAMQPIQTMILSTIENANNVAERYKKEVLPILDLAPKVRASLDY